MSGKQLIASLVLVALALVAYVFWPRPVITAFSGIPQGDAYATSSPAAAATPTATSTNPTKPDAVHTATIETTKGTIQIELYAEDAPNTVANFEKLASSGFYDGVIFHRVIEGFMIQGGDPTGTGRGGPGYTFADELNPSTPSYQAGYVRGTVAMANAGPNTNGSQFFIVQKDYPLPHSYTIFGRVTSGMDVVDAIAGAQTDASDRPLEPIAMTKVTVSQK